MFEVTSPEGPRALKIFSEDFSSGRKGEIELARIQQQLKLRGHDCPTLVHGGKTAVRLAAVCFYS